MVPNKNQSHTHNCTNTYQHRAGNGGKHSNYFQKYQIHTKYQMKWQSNVFLYFVYKEVSLWGPG